MATHDNLLQLSRGIEEIAKKRQSIATILTTILPGILSIFPLIWPVTIIGIAPTVLVAAVFGTWVRARARALAPLGRVTRHRLRHLHASGRSVPEREWSFYCDRAPPKAQLRGAALPDAAVVDYFGDVANTTTETVRLRHNVAISAFFSYRLALRIGQLHLVASVALLVLGGIVLYSALLTDLPNDYRAALANVIVSIIWTSVALSLLNEALSQLQAASSLQTVVDRLRDGSAASDDAMGEWIDCMSVTYDLMRATMRTAPTIVYRMSRRSIQRHWNESQESAFLQ